ncbi:MlaD family protein [Nocardia bovistercoris]|uniref:MCE family protein n=1 Tax=Nocardia bovistercoris TaxID=2785916 RepID=A0A931I9Z1_9NOCA|nr:MlaD family protein [Nocardia bovistercoris]MBH0776776.1 MCE family protein [Nocardia bovistercoris]
MSAAQSSRLRRLGAALLVALAVSVAGCGFQPADITVPGSGPGGPTYPLRIEFANVLNLPTGAKVIAGGVPVGQLTDVTVVDPAPGRAGYVVADVAILKSVRLPRGTTAELQQETPLGDIHIALVEPTSATSGDLDAGGTIPLADTAQSPVLEDILASLSVFVGSGAITDIQEIVRKMNAVMPKDPRDTARIAGTLGADLTDLSRNLDSVDSVLDGLGSTVQHGVLDNGPILDALLTPYGVQHTTDAINAQIGVIRVLAALGPVAPAAAWLAPLVGSLDRTVVAIVPLLFGSQPFDTSSPSNLKTLVDLLQNKIIPFTERGPRLDVTEVAVAGAAMPPSEQTTRIVDTLRMIGVVR